MVGVAGALSHDSPAAAGAAIRLGPMVTIADAAAERWDDVVAVIGPTRGPVDALVPLVPVAPATFPRCGR